jgi:hypothetical protein
MDIVAERLQAARLILQAMINCDIQSRSWWTP